MSFLVTKRKEHADQCFAAIDKGKKGQAIYHAGKTAEMAYALACQCKGELAKRYLANAEAWLDVGEELRKKADCRVSLEAPVVDGDGEESCPILTAVSPESPVTFDAIAGMTEAKQTVLDTIVYPMLHPEHAKALRIRLGGGVLLFGPPGNGKTTLAKAVAQEIDAAFFYASGADIRSKWHGESEKRLKRLIQSAREAEVAILFLDDIDGLLPKRRSHSVVDNRIVTQFLAEVNGFEDNPGTLLILGATNAPWQIDEAVFRTGRFDEKIYVPPPDEEARKGILHRELAGLPLTEGVDEAVYAHQLQGYTGSDIVAIVNKAKRSALRRAVRTGNPPCIQETDVLEAMKQIPPSVTDKLIEKYEDFLKKRFRTPGAGT